MSLAVLLSATPEPAANAGADPTGWWIGVAAAVVLFGVMVWQTLRRNRLRK